MKTIYSGASSGASLQSEQGQREGGGQQSGYNVVGRIIEDSDDGSDSDEENSNLLTGDSDDRRPSV
jgi:hypothetical protein